MKIYGIKTASWMLAMGLWGGMIGCDSESTSTEEPCDEILGTCDEEPSSGEEPTGTEEGGEDSTVPGEEGGRTCDFR